MSVETLASMMAANTTPQLLGQTAGRLLIRQAIPAAFDQVKLLLSDYQGTKKSYLESQPDPNASIEQRRAVLLKRMAEAQNRILFEVRDPELIARVVPFAIEQTTTLYGVTKEAEFAPLEMGVTQLDALLNVNASALAARRVHRAWAVGFTLCILGALVALVWVGSIYQLTAKTKLPIVGIPLPVIIWSIIGSLGAMLYRFNSSAEAELADPLRWSFTRPLTGILMGIVAYMVFQAGITVLQPEPPNATSEAAAVGTHAHLLWLAAFLAGFSDKFADTVIRSLAGRLGGDRSGELVTTAATVSTSTNRMSIFSTLFSTKSAAKPAVIQPVADAAQPVMKPASAESQSDKIPVVDPSTLTLAQTKAPISPEWLDNIIHPATIERDEKSEQKEGLDAVSRTTVPAEGISTVTIPGSPGGKDSTLSG